jgi:hypothetical protein
MTKTSIRTAFHTVTLVPALAAAAVVMTRTAPCGAVPAWTSSTRLWAPADLDLTVVLPSYNPGPALTRTVLALCDALTAAGLDAEVIVSCDGSTDGSEDEVEGIDPRVVVLRAPANAGKGAALHRGFAAARGRHIAYLDADGDIAVDHVVRYWLTAVTGGHDIVYADKRHRESAITATAFRKVLSWGFQTVVSAFFDLPARDTQTGCKVVRRDVLATVVPLLRERGFAIDLELFVAAQANGYDDVAGRPVEIGERLAGSTVSSSSIVRTLREALTILGRLRLGHGYGRPAVLPAATVTEPVWSPSAPVLARTA